MLGLCPRDLGLSGLTLLLGLSTAVPCAYQSLRQQFPVPCGRAGGCPARGSVGQPAARPPGQGCTGKQRTLW